MQEQSDIFSEFSERSDNLAGKMGIRISDLPRKIGISTSMFYVYRTGKHPISRKAWLKLEAAEKAVGLGVHESDVNARLAALENKFAALENALASLALILHKSGP